MEERQSRPRAFPSKNGPHPFFEGKALGTRLEERKLLSPAPLSVRLEQTEGTPYEQLPHY